MNTPEVRCGLELSRHASSFTECPFPRKLRSRIVGRVDEWPVVRPQGPRGRYHDAGGASGKCCEFRRFDLLASMDSQCKSWNAVMIEVRIGVSDNSRPHARVRDYH